MKRLVSLLLIISLITPQTIAYHPQIAGIAHYRDGFLVLTAGSSSNTTQLWLYEPGKGFKLLNETLPNLTFVHSSGKEVLLYRNVSDVYSAPDIQFYVYDGALHFAGGFNGVTDCWDELSMYWNGKFYMIFQPWEACQMTGYNWYALVNTTVYPLLDDDRGRSTVCTGSKCYVGNIQMIPNGYLVGYTNFYTEITNLRAVVFTPSGIKIENITFGNLSAEWGGSCFNGTHFGVLVDNYADIAFYNETVWRFYLGIINTTGGYTLIPLDSVPKGKNISLSLLGSYDGRWIVRKYRYWYSWNPTTGRNSGEETLGYLIVSPSGGIEVSKSLNVTPICEQNWPLLVFRGRSPVDNTPLLNGCEVNINESILTYQGRSFELHFSPKMGDCGNGCLFSDGRELVYFNGSGVQLVEFPKKNTIGTGIIVVLGLVFAAMLIVFAVKWARD